MNKVIWMSWLQGVESKDIPLLNKVCIKRWKELNPSWEVNLLDNSTISTFVPEYFDIINKSNAPIQKQANLLRLLLLKKFGGVWADASLYPEEPIGEYIDKILNHVGFFSYRFLPREVGGENGDRETVNWFLAVDKPNHYLICAWLDKILPRYEINFEWKKYFQMHQDLCDIYDSDSKIRYIINNMVQISEKIPHCCNKGVKNCKSWNNRINSYMYKRPDIPEDLLIEMIN